MTKTPKQIAKAAKASSPIPEAQERNMWSMIVNQGVPYSPTKTYQKRWKKFQRKCWEEFHGPVQIKEWKDQQKAWNDLKQPWTPDTDVI